MTRTFTRTEFPPATTTVVTDAGLETWLMFDRGFDLPAFASYPLAATTEGRAALDEYFANFVAIAASVDAAVVLETPTWRANPDWAATLGHDLDTLADLIARSVEVVDAHRREWRRDQPFLVSGNVGPRGDGYVVGASMSADEATEYHSFQIAAMATHPIDVVTAMTIGYVEEAVGIVRAARNAAVPVVISFTVELDGRLPSGVPLAAAIEATDAATGGYAHHYMVNCAHPSHFADVLDGSAAWASRIGGIRANASTRSHAELDEAEELDRGDAGDLARRYEQLRAVLPALQVVGGCCGTDHRHVGEIAKALASTPVAA